MYEDIARRMSHKNGNEDEASIATPAASSSEEEILMETIDLRRWPEHEDIARRMSHENGNEDEASIATPAASSSLTSEETIDLQAFEMSGLEAFTETSEQENEPSILTMPAATFFKYSIDENEEALEEEKLEPLPEEVFEDPEIDDKNYKFENTEFDFKLELFLNKCRQQGYSQSEVVIGLDEFPDYDDEEEVFEEDSKYSRRRYLRNIQSIRGGLFWRFFPVAFQRRNRIYYPSADYPAQPEDMVQVSVPLENTAHNLTFTVQNSEPTLNVTFTI